MIENSPSFVICREEYPVTILLTTAEKIHIRIWKVSIPTVLTQLPTLNFFHPIGKKRIGMNTLVWLNVKLAHTHTHTHTDARRIRLCI